MADLVRVSLFALCLGTVVLSSLALVGPLRLGAAATLLAVWVVGAGQLVLLAQVLSLLHTLDGASFLVGHVLILGATAVLMLRQPLADPRLALQEIRAGLCRLVPVVSDWRTPGLPIVAGATLLTGLTNAVVALWVPPNNLDALAYHMARVGYYLQFRSLEHYPTGNLFQVVYPANGEILILWTVAFLHSDRLANAVQLTAWALTIVAVYGLGRRSGLGSRAALFGAGAFALLPQSVLQSTSTHNDLLVASFVATSLLFLLDAARMPRPATRLVLAAAAAGLAAGTKGTALLALPGLAAVFLVVFGWRLTRQSLAGVLTGGVMAAMLGSYIYAQNWYLYGSPFGSSIMSRLTRVSFPLVSWDESVSTLARTLFAFAFADLSGPLADPRAAPMVVPLVEALAATGERLFTALAIPAGAGATGADDGIFPPFTFARMPIIDDYVSGVGLVGGAIVAFSVVSLVWPGRAPAGRRLLAWTTLSYLVVMSLTMSWSAFGGGRFLLTACALGAPLMGLIGERQGRSHRTLALILALWSGATGLYVGWFNHYKPVPRIVGQDRLALTFPEQPSLQELFREVDQEVGPSATVGVYGDVHRYGVAYFPEYPLFGPRFARTLVPLVDPTYAERIGLRRPLAWSNESLLATYRPSYLVVQSRRSGAEELEHIMQGRCVQVALRHGKPAIPWELWRCDDWDRPHPQGQ